MADWSAAVKGSAALFVIMFLWMVVALAVWFSRVNSFDENCPTGAIIVPVGPNGVPIIPAHSNGVPIIPAHTPAGAVCPNGAPVMCPVGYMPVAGTSQRTSCMPVAPTKGPVVYPICPTCPGGQPPMCPAGYTLQGVLSSKKLPTSYVVQCVKEPTALGDKTLFAAPHCGGTNGSSSVPWT